MNVHVSTKKLFLIAAVLSLLAVVFAPAASVAATHGKKAGKAKVVQAAKQAAKLNKKIAELKKQANREIDHHLRHLARLQARVGFLDRLTQADRDALVADIQAETAALGALRAEVNAATDVATLRVKLRTIKRDHQLGIFDMRIARLRAAFDVGSQISALEAEGVTMDNRLAEAEAASLDVSALLPLAADFDNQVAAAEAGVAQAVALYTGMKPSIGLHASVALLKQGNAALEGAKASLAQAVLDLTSINEGLAALTPAP